MYNCLINPLQIFLHAPDPRKSSLAYIYHTVTYSVYGKDAVVTTEKEKKKVLQITAEKIYRERR